eukprot:12418728-Karenia_brevis.AAC.1
MDDAGTDTEREDAAQVRKRPAAQVCKRPAAQVLKRPAAAAGGALKFPGTPPAEGCGALNHNGWRIYTDMTMSAWRVKPPDSVTRCDRAFSWKTAPRESWAELEKLVAGDCMKGFPKKHKAK